MLAKDAEIRSEFRVVSRTLDKKFDKRVDERVDERVDKRYGGWRPRPRARGENPPSRPKCAKSTRATFTHTTDLREVMIRRKNLVLLVLEQPEIQRRHPKPVALQVIRPSWSWRFGLLAAGLHRVA